MATILLSAAGAAIGGGFGGTFLGLSGAVIGRAIGASVGMAIDQRVAGTGSRTVETGRVDRLRLTSAREGEGLETLWGRVRIAGQVIWATRFVETVSSTTAGGGGGKGARRAPEVTTVSYSYSVSLAIALCEGEILRIGRIWADGVEIDPASLNMRVYPGDENQLADPKIEAVEGAGMAPSYRGIAYVVLEDLALDAYGNRVPQFSFEVMRRAQGDLLDPEPDLTQAVRGVALIPGTGEYSLATTAVTEIGIGSGVTYPASSVLSHFNRTGITDTGELANQHALGSRTDMQHSLDTLGEELPQVRSASLVVSWFGDDLRCGVCAIRPGVASNLKDGCEMPWRVSGIDRAGAAVVPRLDGRSVYGGTPADASVIEAIQAIKASGKAVMFYPFILMDQLSGNGRADPWSDANDQAVLPWRGRITLSKAPGQEETPDRTAAAKDEVEAFFGAAQPEHFAPSDATVLYSGPEEWSLRRFILHYAHLCAMAGGVDAFCISSEMRSLTQIRATDDRFPAVDALRQLARDVRGILGSGCRISYAADWSEYFGYNAPEGNRYFHLDPLWADPAIDFVGIDNYMPLSDWRDGEDHADAAWGGIYDLDYLKANIEGGEGYDWYYASDDHRAAQIRTPIADGSCLEPWMWRCKDIRGWWENDHHDRIDGVQVEDPSPWVPRSKPIWFTEYGCAAIDKGTNQPNKFLDPKSSESTLPHYSNGRRDDLIQMQYLRAMNAYWDDDAHNPVSDIYDGPMIDMSRAHVWAWDTRPYPEFPELEDLWADGDNYPRGHWISGRAVSQPLSNVVGELCDRAGLGDIDIRGLYGVVRGYSVDGSLSPRGALQALSLAYGFDAVEREGKLVFRMRDARVRAALKPERLALASRTESLEFQRASDAEIAQRVRLSFAGADGSYETRSVEAVFPGEMSSSASRSEIPLTLTHSEGLQIAQRWLSEARVARDTATFSIPPSMGWLGPGDTIALETDEGTRRYRIDRTEQGEAIEVEAVRVERGIYLPSDEEEADLQTRPFVAASPVVPVFLDLPLLTGDEIAHAPHLAVTADPWPGGAALYSAIEDAGYVLNTRIGRRTVIGETLSNLERSPAGLWDRGAALRVKLIWGDLETVSVERVLTGSNSMAIGDGSAENWEIFQFVEAVPVAEGIWDLGHRLRGQLGSDTSMPGTWPAGSVVVLLDHGVDQIKLAASARTQTRHYRVGPATRGYDDPSFIHTEQAFNGIGLRPYSPCHLRVEAIDAGWSIRWTRRTRIDGDNWANYDVPLGEANERYLLRIHEGNIVRRELELTRPNWTYGQAEKTSDGIAGDFAVSVAQFSDLYGPGAFARTSVSV